MKRIKNTIFFNSSPQFFSNFVCIFLFVLIFMYFPVPPKMIHGCFRQEKIVVSPFVKYTGWFIPTFTFFNSIFLPHVFHFNIIKKCCRKYLSLKRHWFWVGQSPLGANLWHSGNWALNLWGQFKKNTQRRLTFASFKSMASPDFV